MRRLGTLALLAFIAVGIGLATRGGSGIEWRALGPGLEFATIRGEPYCRAGSSNIAVLRVDPARVRIGVHHFSMQREGQPLNIFEWQQRTGAVAVFNAGQYYPDHTYMGLLVSDGRTVSNRLHPGFKAALVAEPERSARGGTVLGRARARVLDLEVDPLDPAAPGWREVAQSFMLFDRSGGSRVRRSDRVANRTVVGEDRNGRMLVITTEGGYTLWETAQCLRESALDLTHAMSMDGGAESKLVIRSDDFSYASFGPWDGGDGTGSAASQVALPTVVTVTPR